MERHEPSVERQGNQPVPPELREEAINQPVPPELREEAINQPVPPELREEAIKKILEKNPKMEEHTKIQMKDQMERNGRWGTCVDCPDDQGRTYGNGRSNKVMTENCPNTDRYDHWLGTDALDEK